MSSSCLALATKEEELQFICTDTPTAGAVYIVTVADARSAFLSVHLQKATGLDAVPSGVLGTCVDQLAGVFIDIFNLSRRLL